MSLIEQLALKLNKSEGEVSRFLQSAPKKYKVYTIPKRTSGHRVIAQPSKELKKYQRNYLEIQNLPIHDSAMAYRDGLSIKQNAISHKNNPYLLKMDLEISLIQFLINCFGVHGSLIFHCLHFRIR